MNLVQINERLKDLPMQVIQQYANGMNPEVPPYLALGELQRRELAQKQMATAQGAAQGPQLSVKEQVEQKAGLMAAQALQQQQMMQQMAQPRGPMPAPAGVPQPEAQPQPTMMAARGGLARAPVRFDFQHGGIVAFSGKEGSQVKKPLDAEAQKAIDEAQRSGDRSAMLGLLKNLAAAGYDLATLIPRAAMGVTEDLSNTRVGRALGVDFQLPQSAYGGNRASMTPMMDRISAEEPQQQSIPQMTSPQPTDQTYTRRMGASAPDSPLPPMTSPQPDEQTYVRKAGPTSPVPIADLKALEEQKKQQRQQPPRPAPTPAAVAPAAPAPAAPAQPDPNSMDAMFRAQLSNAPKERTLEEQLAEQKAARTGAGMTESAGLAQLERIRKLQEQYESSKPSGLDDLIRVFGQSGQYKGLSGLAPAYTANQQQKRAADLAMAQKINQLMSGVETTQRGEMKDIATGALAGLGTDRAAGAEFGKTKLSSLGTAATGEANRKTQERGQDITARTQERGQDLQLQAQQLNARANAAGRPFNIVETQFNLLKTGDSKKDAELLQKLAAQHAEGKKPGIDMELLKKFESLPGVKTDLETLSALRMIGSPKPETVTRIRQIESRLAAKAKQNGMDPARIGITADAPVESVGGASKPSVVDFSSLPK